MKLYEELNKKFAGVLHFDNFKDKYALLNTTDKLNHPEIKVYIAMFPNKSYKIFDGGNTLNLIKEKLLNKDFKKEYSTILEKNKVKEEDSILFIDCEEALLVQSLFKIYDTQKEIFEL